MTLAAKARKISKKDQILALAHSGITDVKDLEMLTNTTASYVATVLSQAGVIDGYFDLYTTTSHPQNIYGPYFANRLGFKTLEIAKESVKVIDEVYTMFEKNKDRAGQHHAMTIALTMFNRARWINKLEEADQFRQWLFTKLDAFDLLG